MMSWGDIQGHDQVVEQFRRALERGRLASTFLFVGPPGVGKRRFAQRLAQALLCEAPKDDPLEPCENCPACQQVQALTHPDLEVVVKPKDRSFIPIELFIGDREHRMREGLCHRISLKPYRGGRKVAIIDDADHLNQEGANCLLKTLEEPPPRSLVILIGTSEQKQLPTIRSRCQVVRFRPLQEAIVAELLLSQGLIDDPQRAAELASLSGGSLQRALEMDDSTIGEFRQTLLLELCQPDWNAVELSRTMAGFVDEAGKDAPSRRERMNQLIEFSVEFYRQLMRDFSGMPVEGDEILQRAVAAAHRDWPGNAESAAACLDRCLDAQGQVQANANQATLLDCWLDELAMITRTASPIAPARSM
ncbi:MAG: DNA polymerase III subunit [Planctomycetes bacterium]|nr:DNA polymerase III subunit [Planctomycetota bacterium]